MATPPLSPYLSADTCGGITEGQDGHVLGPVQPGHRDLGAGRPLHHGDVILPEDTNKGVSRGNGHQGLGHTPLLDSAASEHRCGVLERGHPRTHVGPSSSWKAECQGGQLTLSPCPHQRGPETGDGDTGAPH